VCVWVWLGGWYARTSFKAHVEWRLQHDIRTLLKRRIAHERALWTQWPHVYMGRDL
jgi:hypothetical protein